MYNLSGNTNDGDTIVLLRDLNEILTLISSANTANRTVIFDMNGHTVDATGMMADYGLYLSNKKDKPLTIKIINGTIKADFCVVGEGGIASGGNFEFDNVTFISSNLYLENEVTGAAIRDYITSKKTSIANAVIYNDNCTLRGGLAKEEANMEITRGDTVLYLNYTHYNASSIFAAGDTVKLLKDIDMGSSYIKLDKAITFDLNGFNVTSASEYGTIQLYTNNIAIVNNGARASTIQNTYAKDGVPGNKPAIRISGGKTGITVNGEAFTATTGSTYEVPVYAQSAA